MSEISIVMPIHNTPRKYLTECIDSVLNQTFEDFELICVDDCSDKNNVREVLQEYILKDSRITVIFSDEPIGAAEARNIGLRKSQSKYIIFLDSDDIFDLNLLVELYDNIVYHDADICLCGYEEFSLVNGEYKDGIKNIPLDYDNNMTIEEWKLSLPCVPWNRICKKEYLLYQGIDFQNLTSTNDVSFCFLTAICAKKISVIDKVLVKYRVGTEFQISSTKDSRNIYKAFSNIKQTLAAKKINNSILEKKLDLIFLKWTIVALVKWNNETSIKEEVYKKCHSYFEEKILDNWGEKDKLMIQIFLDSDFESILSDTIFSVERQLEYNSNKLISLLESNDKCIVWGLGYRGKAFISWADKHAVKIMAVCDKKNDRCGEKFMNKINIISTEEAINSNALIVASNNEIYEYLSKCYYKCILNLEKYCPV